MPHGELDFRYISDFGGSVLSRPCLTWLPTPPSEVVLTGA